MKEDQKTMLEDTPRYPPTPGETNKAATLLLDDISLSDSQTSTIPPTPPSPSPPPEEEYRPRQRRPQTGGWGEAGGGGGGGGKDEDPLGLRKLAVVLVDEFLQAAMLLDKHAQNVNIARVGGGSFAVAGGITAIVGFALIPVTMGLSALVAGITGAAIAAAGGMVAGGASVAKIFIEKFKLKPLVQKWVDFNEMMIRQLQQRDPEAFRRMQDELKSKIGQAAGTAGAAAGAEGAGAGGVRAGVVAASVAGVQAAAAARLVTIAAAGSIALNGVLIGISLYDIIDGSISLYNKRGSKAGDYLRQLAKSLDTFARTGSFGYISE